MFNRMDTEKILITLFRSYGYAWIRVVDHVRQVLDDGGCVNDIYMDFRKEFHTMIHPTLLLVVNYFVIQYNDGIDCVHQGALSLQNSRYQIFTET